MTELNSFHTQIIKINLKFMQKYLYIALAILLVWNFTVTRSLNKLQKEYRNIVDLRTTELIQRDSLQKVYEVDKKQLKNIILKQDSSYQEIIKQKDLKISQLNSLSKIEVIDTLTLKDTIFNQVPIIKDTTYSFIKPIKCIEISGDLKIKNNNIDLILNSIKLNLTITIVDYYDIIYWYNFKKRKENGYSLIGFRNHYISKVTAYSKDFNEKLKVELIKVKK